MKKLTKTETLTLILLLDWLAITKPVFDQIRPETINSLKEKICGNNPNKTQDLFEGEDQ